MSAKVYEWIGNLSWCGAGVLQMISVLHLPWPYGFAAGGAAVLWIIGGYAWSNCLVIKELESWRVLNRRDKK